jgi:hypothetical protein
MGDSILTSARFWQQTGVRCVKTFAQATGGALGASATGAISADWVQALTVGAGAAIIALLMSLERIEELPPDTAEELAVDAIMHAGGVASGDPLTPLAPPPTAATTTTTTTTNTTPTPPPPPVSTTSQSYESAWQPPQYPPTPPVSTTGYPGLGDPA